MQTFFAKIIKNGESMNQIFLVGKLGQDPKMKYTGSGKALCEFGVATFNGKDMDPTWHNVVCWGALAERCNQFLGKGRHVTIMGKQDNEVYEKDGMKKYYSKVIAFGVYWDNPVHNKDNKDNKEGLDVSSFKTVKKDESFGFTADDIPF